MRMINGFSEGVFRQRERNALMPLSQVLLTRGGNFNKNVFVSKGVPEVMLFAGAT